MKRQVEARELKKVRETGKAYTPEEKDALIKGLMTLPKDRIAAAMRSAGLMAEADAYEQQQAENHLQELRDEKLKSIRQLPQAEQLAELIANGFDEEAKALSEAMAAEQPEAEAPSATEENVPEENIPEQEQEVKAEAPATKKNAGRPKKK